MFEMGYKLVYATTNDEKEAERIGKALLKEGLAACVNTCPIKSLYKWKGKVCKENETAMLIKTKAGLVDKVIERVKALHSYEVPCIVSLPIEKGYAKFLKWIDESTI
jgi:periplasmic divalent cation tolerance protein